MFLFFLFYKQSFRGENVTHYDIGSYSFTKTGVCEITFTSMNQEILRYNLSFCVDKYFYYTEICDNSTIQIRKGGQTHLEHLVAEDGTYFIKLIPLQKSSEEFLVILKNGNFYNDYRENWVNLTQAILIILVLIVLIIYSKNMSGHFKKLNFFPILSGVVFIGCQCVLLVDSVVRLFSNQTIFFKGLNTILRLGGYICISTTLAIYSGAATFSGLEMSCHRNTLLIFDIIFVFLFFLNIGVFKNFFIPLLVQTIIYSIAIILLSGIYRWKTKTDYRKTFDAIWPKEISSIATGSFLLISLMVVLYSVVVMFQYCFDDFYYQQLIISDIIFALIIVFTYMLSNKRMDLIVLNQPLVE